MADTMGHKLTASVNALLKALEKLMEYDSTMYSLKYHEKQVKDAEEELRARKQMYENSISSVEREKRDLAQRRYEAAQIINDLGRLRCPEEVLKKAMHPLNAHDVATWIKLDE
jgi:chromosome segregation ATPase